VFVTFDHSQQFYQEMVRIIVVQHSKLQSPKAMNYNAKGRSSDLLPVYRLPFHYKLESGLEWQTVVELTAAGQLRIYTVFPFNSEALPTETKSGANIAFWLFSCLVFLFLVH